MADDIPIDPDEPFALAAARIVRARADELFAAQDGVLDLADIERVHDMRVATRRLRAVLEIFAPCFPRAEHRALLKEVTQLADALGERRDPDVQAEAMQRLAASAPAEDGPGIELVVERLGVRRQAANAALALALERAREDSLHERLLALAQAAQETPA
jgi:CHAD domain-containing protein